MAAAIRTILDVRVFLSLNPIMVTCGYLIYVTILLNFTDLILFAAIRRFTLVVSRFSSFQAPTSHPQSFLRCEEAFFLVICISLYFLSVRLWQIYTSSAQTAFCH